VYSLYIYIHITRYFNRYRIGTLSPEEAEEQRTRLKEFTNPYDDDPPVKPELLTNTRFPYNAEARLRSLTDSWVTPTERHFVRNHCHVCIAAPKLFLKRIVLVQ